MLIWVNICYIVRAGSFLFFLLYPSFLDCDTKFEYKENRFVVGLFFVSYLTNYRRLNSIENDDYGRNDKTSRVFRV